MSRTILIVDDHKHTIELVRMYLEKEGYIVFAAFDGRQAVELIRQKRPDLVILDLMLPKVDGLDVCRIIRAESDMPIIMLTARSTEDDMLLGLDLGADDYVTKPFSPREVVARVRTVLRRFQQASNTTDDAPSPEILTFGELVIDLFRHEVRLGEAILGLTPKEFRLLEIMARDAGRAITRDELVQAAFGADYEGLPRTVDVHIMKLRKKLGDSAETGGYIETVYGIGYRFNGEPHRSNLL